MNLAEQVWMQKILVEVMVGPIQQGLAAIGVAILCNAMGPAMIPFGCPTREVHFVIN